MKIASAILGSLVILGLGGQASSPAHAQVNPDIQLGSKIPVRPEKPDPVKDGLVRDRYVSCAYGPHQKQIDGLLAISDPLTVDFEGAGIKESKMFRQWNIRECFVAQGDAVQTSISFSRSAFRYMMLEAAYLRAHPEVPANHEKWVAKPRDYVTTGDMLPTVTALGTMSDCIAVQDSVGADKLLRTASGTQKEKQAAMDLVPALSACIVAGQQLQLTPANIRGFAADGLWQRFVAGAPSASDGTPPEAQD
ncbi:MAG: hypothetical protein V7679_15505 [Parasphingorhabdus sp.]